MFIFGSMNSIDVILSIFLLFGLIRGFFKGFFVELAGLLALIIGIYIALHYSEIAFAFLEDLFSWDENYLLILSFAVTFFIVALLVVLLGRILTKILNLVALGILNKLAGAIFGLIKMAFFISLFFMFVNASPAYGLGEEAKETSVLYGTVEGIAPFLLPSIIERLDELEIFDPTPEEEVSAMD